jgi:hypothetical protein
VPWTTQSFINCAKTVHGNRYDYSLVEYKNVDTKVKIVCKEHGVFEQTPYNHMRGSNCQVCANNKSSLTNFTSKAKKIHNNRYDYSLVNYKTAKINVTIICKTHGKFDQQPNNHLTGTGCPKCAIGNPVLENKWIDSFKNDNIIRQHRIILKDGTTVIADGYDPTTNTVYEFWGDFWHGNLKIYESTDINPINKLSYGELYKQTQHKINLYKDNGFKLIDIWEKDYKEYKIK